MTWLSFLYLLLAMVLGAILLRVGLRGRRINDHPVCRQCRFDLVGQPEPLTTCPECGCGLRRPGWVRIGQRKRMPIVAGVGVLLLLLPALLIGSAVAVVATGSNLDKHTPTGLLLWQARHMSPARLGAIAEELEWRASGGKFKKDELARVAEVALEVQGDLGKPWSEKWGDLIEQAHTEDALSKEQWERFCRHAITLEFRTRPMAQEGNSIPVIATQKESRVGSASQLMAIADWYGSEIEAGASSLQPASTESRPGRWQQVLAPTSSRKMDRNNPFGRGIFHAVGSKSRYSSMPVERSVGAAVPVPAGTRSGPSRIAIEIVTEAKDFGRSNQSWGDISKSASAAHHYAELPIEILPNNVDSVESVPPDAELKRRMEQFVRPGRFEIQIQNVPPQRTYRGATVAIPIKPCPIDFAFDVFYRTKDGEHRLGSVSSSQFGTLDSGHLNPPTNGSIYCGAPVKEFDDETVDLIFRPKTSIAMATIDLTRIYGEEIVIRDVPVEVTDYTSSNPRPVRRKPKTESKPESKPASELKASTIDDAPAGEKPSESKDGKSPDSPKQP